MTGPALNTDPRDPVAEELHLMKTAGIVEVASRNPNIMDAIRHWEDRVQKAEAAVAAARAEGMRAMADIATDVITSQNWSRGGVSDAAMDDMLSRIAASTPEASK
jgi:hypothetical protein